MRPLFGFDDASHGHARGLLKNVRLPAAIVLLGRGPRLRDRAARDRHNQSRGALMALEIIKEAVQAL